MLLRNIFIALAALIALAAGWRFLASDSGRGLLAPRGVPPPPIKFDNGTVRVYAPASAAADAGLPPGAMRKCVGSQATSYSDRPCPPGMREQPVAGGMVTVVPANGPATAAARADAPATGAKTLREAMVGDGSDQLREQTIERAIRR